MKGQSNTQPVDLVDDIATETAEVIALLHMVRVFCNLEKRDMDGGAIDGTLSDAADGLAILMGDLAGRVESIKDKATKMYELWPETLEGCAK
jgi:hypothetical protein